MQIKVFILSFLVASASAKTFVRTSTTSQCSAKTTVTRTVTRGVRTNTVTKTVTQTVTKSIGGGAPKPGEVTLSNLPKCPPSKTITAYRTCLQNVPSCPRESACPGAIAITISADCSCIGGPQVTATVFNTRCKGDCACTPRIEWNTPRLCSTTKLTGSQPSSTPGGKGSEKEEGEEKEELPEEQEEQEEIPEEQEEVNGDDAMGGY
ncbi:hypothetical protein TWF281_005180 [Arthrobotrys megalospora]